VTKGTHLEMIDVEGEVSSSRLHYESPEEEEEAEELVLRREEEEKQ